VIGRFTLLLALAAACLAEAAEDRFPRVAGAYIVKRDGRVLWAAREEQRLAPASLTKLMTALLVLERGHLEEVVVVSRRATAETGSTMGLKPGDNVRERELLAAMVVRSANDACQALADHVSKDFVGLMNRRAAAMGLKNTRFVNACGHDGPGHYSTAADLARLAEQVTQHEEFRRLAKLDRVRIATVDGRRRFQLVNTNTLVGRYDGVIGIKTGSTSRAGNCLIALAERNGVTVLVVMLNSPNRWRAAPDLLDSAFAKQL
jgi:D-alanyl-D-alanine carboxypeptidase (penicillin-binding protein 5/6)